MFGRAGLKVLSAARRTFGKGAALRVADPVRSDLAASIDDWPWSSCCRNELGDPCPMEVETNWLAHVDEPLSGSQLASIRQSVNRQRPLETNRSRSRLTSFRAI
jgi:hypothetical protein